MQRENSFQLVKACNSMVVRCENSFQLVENSFDGVHAVVLKLTQSGKMQRTFTGEFLSGRDFAVQPSVGRNLEF